ncbi:unnamed protein product [Cyprideis torosa]|uniref:Uncharacterized protein n=1 Tax=Cyprideis torosa TaxID=163714 RepID=A0A7R8WEV9_9CRUS|nr:unnamed protein product [Cyprideis torosa]CAG0896119.1 unnamed protein product [Cyprideis torosa]
MEDEKGGNTPEHLYDSDHSSSHQSCQECVHAVEGDDLLCEKKHQEAWCLATEKMYQIFQSSAAAVAQMYNDRNSGVSIYPSFQMAAEYITSLHKEGLENFRRGMEIGVLTGSQRKRKEILSWARRRKSRIRKDDLVAVLAGKGIGSGSPAPSHSHHPYHGTHLPLHHPLHLQTASATGHPRPASSPRTRRPTPPTPERDHGPNRQAGNVDDLFHVMLRLGSSVKRSASPSAEASMDSPTTSKRPRFY